MNSALWYQDQADIRSLIEKYADSLCRQDPDAIMALWADECRWSVLDMPGLENIVGKDEIRATWVAALKAFPFTFLVCMPGHIAVTSDTAVARVYCTEVLIDTAGAVRHGVGRYDDRFVRTSDGWRFSERVWNALHKL